MVGDGTFVPGLSCPFVGGGAFAPFGWSADARGGAAAFGGSGTFWDGPASALDREAGLPLPWGSFAGTDF
jgi:hypothetical protein